MPWAGPPGAPKTAEPATITVAPASTTRAIVCGSIPPLTSSSKSQEIGVNLILLSQMK